MPRLVQIHRRGSVAVLTLNRPEALNALNGALRDALISGLGELNRDPDIRAVVITGAGDRAFCAGQDLAEASSFRLDEVEAWTRHQRATFQSIREMDKPVVAALTGTAAGAGFQIGLLTDIRVGYPEMRIGQPEVRVGLASIVGSHLMTLHVGLGHNLELSLRGNLIDGSRAYEIGLLNHLVPRDQVMPKAMELATELAGLPEFAIRLTKRRFREITQAAFDEACAAGAEYQRDAYESGQPWEIMTRFLEERSARRPN